MSLIQLNQVYLKYKTKSIYDLSLKQRIIRVLKNQSAPIKVVNALHDLTLSIKSGDKIGVIGRNGAGKSSLLKLTSGIYPPTQGTIRTKGKIHSIINTSLGLRNELSGYENIIYKGILLGLKVKDIRRKIKKITEFAEIEDRLYDQLSTYSAGMRMRLALSILLSVESDILLIDEVFNTLDAQFMEKYHQALLGNINQTAITIFVSHSLEIISTFCTDVIWLEQGRLQQFGKKEEVIKQYSESLIT
jgi:ABC-2 type transport system ATP-binding protein